MKQNNILKYKLPLRVFFDNKIIVNGYPTYERNLEDLKFNEVTDKDISELDGQYDWIEAWANTDWHKKDHGFNAKDVVMDVQYDKGNYIITLLSDKPFDSIVPYKTYVYHKHRYGDIIYKERTLKEAVKDYLDGCISDGIGENEIGYIYYQGEKCDVWMGDLIEI